ncbi:MAG: addiction module protein [Lentisphaeria bacterium]|nr:addiction module protein [Lentisphaeria bacterium]
MINSTAQVLDEALHLPIPARAFLAEKLLESLDSEPDFRISEEWHRDILRRCEEIDSGMIKPVPAETVFRKAFESIG